MSTSSEKEDFKTIAHTLELARAANMETEVVLTLCNELRRGNHDLAAAAWNALYEWDC